MMGIQKLSAHLSLDSYLYDILYADLNYWNENFTSHRILRLEIFKKRRKQFLGLEYRLKDNDYRI